MIHSIFPSLAVAAVALFAARMGDWFLKPAKAEPCAKIQKSAVVWPYEAANHTTASPCTGSAAKRFANFPR